MKTIGWMIGVVLIVGFSVVAQAKDASLVRYRLFEAQSVSQNSDEILKDMSIQDQQISQEVRSLVDASHSDEVRKQAEELLKKWKAVDSSTRSVLFELARDEEGVSLVLRAVDEDRVGVSRIPVQTMGLEKSTYRLAAADLVDALKRASDETQR